MMSAILKTGVLAAALLAAGAAHALPFSFLNGTPDPAPPPSPPPFNVLLNDPVAATDTGAMHVHHHYHYHIHHHYYYQ